MCLIDAIPRSGKNILECNFEQNYGIEDLNFPLDYVSLKINNKVKDIREIKTQEIYLYYLSKTNHVPTCIQAWSSRLSITLNQNDWSDIFMLPKLCVRDILLQEFQYKIIHRYYPCDSKIAKWDKTVEAICKLC